MNFRDTPIAILVTVLALCLLVDDAFAFKMESGSFRINATTGGSPSFTTRSFQQAYDVIPVVIILTTNRGGDSTVVRIRNVTLAGFEATVVETPGKMGRTPSWTCSTSRSNPACIR